MNWFIQATRDARSAPEGGMEDFAVLLRASQFLTTILLATLLTRGAHAQYQQEVPYQRAWASPTQPDDRVPAYQQPWRSPAPMQPQSGMAYEAVRRPTSGYVGSETQLPRYAATGYPSDAFSYPQSGFPAPMPSRSGMANEAFEDSSGGYGRYQELPQPYSVTSYPKGPLPRPRSGLGAGQYGSSTSVSGAAAVGPGMMREGFHPEAASTFSSPRDYYRLAKRNDIAPFSEAGLGPAETQSDTLVAPPDLEGPKLEPLPSTDAPASTRLAAGDSQRLVSKDALPSPQPDVKPTSPAVSGDSRSHETTSSSPSSQPTRKGPVSEPAAAGEPKALVTDCAEGTEEEAFFQYRTFCPRGWWHFDVDMIGLRRCEANDFPLIVDQATSCPVVDVGDLDFDYELGLRARAVRDINCQWSWDLTYLGISEWANSVAVQGALDLRGPGFDLGVNPSVFIVDSVSSLYSVEVNWRKQPCCHWSWLAGFRYMRFNDSLAVSEYNAPFINALNIDAANNLYGLHAGTEFVLYDSGGPLYIGGHAKLGIFANGSRHNTRSSFLGPPLRAHTLGIAFAGEVEFLLAWRFNERFEIRGGYHVLGLGGVALAPDQIHASDLSTGYAPVHTADLLLDGAFLGLRFVW